MSFFFCLSPKVAEHQKEIITIKKTKQKRLCSHSTLLSSLNVYISGLWCSFVTDWNLFGAFLPQLLTILLRAKAEVQSPSDRHAFCLRRTGSTCGIPYANRTKLTIIEATLNTKWNNLKSNQPWWNHLWPWRCLCVRFISHLLLFYLVLGEHTFYLSHSVSPYSSENKWNLVSQDLL